MFLHMWPFALTVVDPGGTVHQTEENEGGGLRREVGPGDKDLVVICVDTAYERPGKGSRPTWKSPIWGLRKNKRGNKEKEREAESRVMQVFYRPRDECMSLLKQNRN